MFPSSATAYQSLSSFKPRSSQDISTEAETKYGIPEATKRVSSLRGLVGNLQSAVEAVDPSVTGRTSGTFTTEGQRQALISKERSPILGDLGKQQSALSNEVADFNTSQGLATQMVQALKSDDQATYQRLLDQYNAATAAEKAAEEKRQYDENLAEQRRQWNEKMAADNAQFANTQKYLKDALAASEATPATPISTPSISSILGNTAAGVPLKAGDVGFKPTATPQQTKNRNLATQIGGTAAGFLFPQIGGAISAVKGVSGATKKLKSIFGF